MLIECPNCRHIVAALRNKPDELEAPAHCTGATGAQSAEVEVKMKIDGVQLGSSGLRDRTEGHFTTENEF